MLNLSLIRHAKSDWINYESDDFSRKISSKGIIKTKKIGLLLKKKGIFFNEILCSPSVRTKQTMEIILTYLDSTPPSSYLDELYHISNKDIFDTVMLYAKKKNILVISHEPLLSTSIESFFYGVDNSNFDRAVEKFSTSSFFNVSFNCENWPEIGRSVAEINFFVRPNDL